MKSWFSFLFLVLLPLSLYSKMEIKAYYLIDKENIFNQSNIYENKNHFTPLSSHHTGFGLQNKTVWIHLHVTNTDNKTNNAVVEFPYAILDYIHYYEFQNGKLINENESGDTIPYSKRVEKTNTLVFPYKIGANSTKELFFEVKSEGALNLKMNYFDRSTYQSAQRDNLMLLGIYYGAVIIMLFYNSILYFMIREKVYLDYVVFHFIYLFLQLGLNGLAYQHFWPSSPVINSYYIPVMLALANFFSIIFSLSFLNIRENHKQIYKYFIVLKYIFVLIAISSFIFSYNHVVKAIALFSILSVISLFISGIYILIKERSVESKFYVTAWSFLLIGVLLTEFQNIGLLPINFFTLYGAQLGAFFELGLFSFALAYRYNTIIVKLRQTESKLLGLNEELELKVHERTQNLDEKNLQLHIEVNNKNVLLRELFHRVKNNLQIISGLLSLQARRLQDKKSKEIFRDTTQRIKSMAIVHEKLYSSENLEAVNMQEYTKSLIEDIKHTFNANDIDVTILCEQLDFDLEIAVPLGLIINEMATNSVKYAFTTEARTKNITIEMSHSTSNKFILEYYDNGAGIDFINLKEGFGFKLINSLTTYQLKGDVDYFNDNGLHYVLSFDKLQHK